MSGVIKFSRSTKRPNFVSVSSKLWCDPRLSVVAKGVVVECMDNDQAWLDKHLTNELLQERLHVGRDALETAFRELEAAGYLIRKTHRGARGQWVHERILREDSPTAPELARKKKSETEDVIAETEAVIADLSAKRRKVGGAW